ncbi:MAG: hypothetical protein KDD06_02975 [Phaeodactylibacter sp.]|nr:hypothetical protein [Phaeodactylibacter sp.]MCB9289330.1 hypothetical protein [Lewinellaceae bacterium]
MIVAIIGTMILVEILMNKNLHGLTIASGIMICYSAKGKTAHEEQELMQPAPETENTGAPGLQEKSGEEKIANENNWVVFRTGSGPEYPICRNSEDRRQPQA